MMLTHSCEVAFHIYFYMSLTFYYNFVFANLAWNGRHSNTFYWANHSSNYLSTRMVKQLSYQVLFIREINISKCAVGCPISICAGCMISERVNLPVCAGS